MALLAHPGQQGAGPPYRGSASQVMLAGHRSFASGAHSPPLARATAPPYIPAFCFACSRRSCTRTLRLISESPKTGKIPPSHHTLEGAMR